jgi:hypothetical protein
MIISKPWKVWLRTLRIASPRISERFLVGRRTEKKVFFIKGWSWGCFSVGVTFSLRLVSGAVGRPGLRGDASQGGRQMFLTVVNRDDGRQKGHGVRSMPLRENV